MRICIIGDELITPMGDPRGLGWVGRVLARSEFPSPPTVLTLAVPGETTSQLAARWEDEVVYRFAPDEPCALIIAVGCSDIPAGISTPRSRLNLANITDRASTLGIPSMVVGPPPLAGVQSSAVKELSLSCQQVCERRDIPFVDTYTPLVAHDQWFEDMASSSVRSARGASMPGQSGFALMAWLVLHQGWFEWTGATPADV